MLTAFPLLALLFLLALKPGRCHLSPKEVCVKPGEMLPLHCPLTTDYKSDDKVVWTSFTPQEVDLTNTSRAEQRHRGVLVHGRSLVILSASAEHQGNYSCSLGNASRRFLVTVDRLCEERNRPDTCFTHDYCELICPDVKMPAINITNNDIMWQKESESLSNDGKFLTFSSVEEKDLGVYTCTRSYLYHGQIYNITFNVMLHVQPKKNVKAAAIVSPRNNEVFDVDLGTEVVINCKAVINSVLDGVVWICGNSSVALGENTSLPVFSKRTKTKESDTLSLVFKKVSEDDLTKNYTCKLEVINNNQKSEFVTIRLQNARPSYVPLALSTVGIVVAMTATVILCVKFKIDITLFLRDTLGCHRRASDGKRYDAFVMCYKSDTDAGLSGHDRRWLELVLEDKFGYRLCLHDRDVQLGKAVADAVLESIEESRTVVLVPTSLDPGLGSGLLSAVHEALVERQTRLILVKSETAKKETASCCLREALQLPSEAGVCVTWRGRSSSSSFVKHLRFHLPASPKESKIRLLRTI